MNSNTDVNLRVTAPGNELVRLGKEFESVAKTVRELKAVLAGMGVDADAALGKITSGSQKTQRAKEEELRLVQRLTESLRTQEQAARAANEARHRDFGRALRGGGIDFNQWKQLSQRSDAQYRKDSGIDKLKEEALREQAASKSADQEARQRAEQIVKDNKQLLSSKRELADAAFKKRHDEGWALVQSGHMTPKEFDATRPGMDKLWMKESGAQSAFDKIANSERDAAARRRQNDQREITRLTEQHATAQERFNARVARANELKKNAGLHESVYKREIAAANKELNGQFNVLGSIGGQVAGLAASYMGVQAIIGGITARVVAWREETEKLRKASNVAADTLELLRKRFQVQGRMTDAEAKGYAGGINAIAQKTAMPLEQAYELATSLQTSGFSAKEASGGSLETLAKFMQAQALSGEELNPKEFAQSFSKFLNANELKPDNKNLTKFASFFQSEQVKATMIKIPDLLYAASEASGLKEFGVGAETQAALAAFMSDKKRVRVGETNLREVVRHMRTAAGSPDKVKVLAGIGLKPEDIDMVGEDFYTAMGRFNKASGKLGEAERGVVMDKLFEGANVGTAGTVMRNLDHIKEMEQKGFADKASLETDASEMTTGRTAANVRGDNEIKIGQSERGSYADQFGKAFEAVALRKGMSGGAIGEQKKWYEYHLASGMTPEAAFARSQGGYNTSVDVRGTVNGRSGESYSPEEFDRFQPENEFRPLTNLMYGPDRRPTRREVEAEFTKNAGGVAEAAAMREQFDKFREDMNNNTVAVERNTEAILLKNGGAPAVPNNKQPVAPRPAEGLSGAMRGDNFKPVPGRMF